MFAPFFKLYIDNSSKKDISELVESFKFEDAVNEDSLLKLTIHKDHAEGVSDDGDFTTGTIIAFQFGFIQGKFSKLHRCRITDIKVKYRERITMDVICLDMGTVMKKVPSQIIYKDKTSIQIASEIAAKYGLTLQSDPTTQIWKAMPQGNKSDMELLKYLAAREDGGNWIVFIRSGTLYFTHRGTEKESSRTFIWGDGDGEVLSFEPTLSESGATGGMNKTVKAQFNAYTGEYEAVIVDNIMEHLTGTLGMFKTMFNENDAMFNGNDTSKTAKEAQPTKAPPKGDLVSFDGDKLGDVEAPPKDGGINTFGTATGNLLERMVFGTNTKPAKTSEEAKNAGNHAKKKATLKVLTAKLVVNGDPFLEPNTTITVGNVAKRFLGNWLVAKVTHDITTSGYLTTLDLNKNGTNQGGGDKKKKKAKDANTSNGPAKSEKKIVIPTVSFDGNKFKK